MTYDEYMCGYQDALIEHLCEIKETKRGHNKEFLTIIKKLTAVVESTKYNDNATDVCMVSKSAMEDLINTIVVASIRG